MAQGGGFEKGEPCMAQGGGFEKGEPCYGARRGVQKLMPQGEVLLLMKAPSIN